MGAAQIAVYGPLLAQASVCEPILRALPERFGIEQAIQQYAREIAQLPTFLASLDDGETVGLITIKQHTECTAEPCARLA